MRSADFARAADIARWFVATGVDHRGLARVYAPPSSVPGLLAVMGSGQWTPKDVRAWRAVIKRYLGALDRRATESTIIEKPENDRKRKATRKSKAGAKPKKRRKARKAGVRTNLRRASGKNKGRSRPRNPKRANRRKAG